ncbi:Protein CBG03222 [Caenorhabditis briggsae]|uniref:Translocation protein SEC62 n=1 Tax=Caenorhabditis briggsae TaxID=6238 RepID=A8WSI6_CAEBR|nr:Protein CBG03222 [Caenorhabditis briggsae]CAP23445.2 Protein CBG03222 [Caenorhabditis briggsae]
MSRRNQKTVPSEDAIKMTKEQEDVAKYIRFNCPTATTMFEGNEVHYFSGNKAVDTLWDSKYGNKAKKDPMFKTRDDCFHYICELNSKQLFFRAKKLVAKKKENKEKGNDSSVKLLVHEIQSFVDDKDVYVWVFDPTPLMKKVIGVLMLVGTIVGCLFPLWPAWLRQAVYYISISGIGIFAAIIVTAILRTILFGIIYAATFGKHKLWILPNLTEDCGVLESFQPWYTYEYCGDGKKKDDKKNNKDKKSKKEKDSDAEDEEKKPTTEPKESEVEDNEDAEKYSQASTDENYEKIDDEEISAPPSPSEGIARKRRPAKV